MIETTSALACLKAARRSDLIFKYRYAQSIVAGEDVPFFREAYLQNIGAFNNFLEEESNKQSREDFVQAFHRIIRSIQLDGFDGTRGAIPVDESRELKDGAHRLAASAALSQDVPIARAPAKSPYYFDFEFFRRCGFDQTLADWGALQNTILNENSSVVLIFPAIDTARDIEIEEMLGKRGYVYYKKASRMNYNGLVNLKHVCYAHEPWYRGASENYKIARAHAVASNGAHPLRAYVYCGETAEAVTETKYRIREVLGVAHEAVHSTDSHDEAKLLAQSLLSARSRFLLNSRPYWHEPTKLDTNLDRLSDTLDQAGVCRDDVCIVGSAPMEAFGIRTARDLNFCARQEINIPRAHLGYVSQHSSEMAHYPADAVELIHDPRHHFYHRGYKFASLDVVARMKRSRSEGPTDVDDRRLIARFSQRNLGPRMIAWLEYVRTTKRRVDRLRSKLRSLRG